jgi:hypothetical protein
LDSSWCIQANDVAAPSTCRALDGIGNHGLIFVCQRRGVFPLDEIVQSALDVGCTLLRRILRMNCVISARSAVPCCLMRCSSSETLAVKSRSGSTGGLVVRARAANGVQAILELGAGRHEIEEHLNAVGTGCRATLGRGPRLEICLALLQRSALCQRPCHHGADRPFEFGQANIDPAADHAQELT